MEYSIEEITSGNLDGKHVYVCDYRLNDEINKKPIRNVRPQRVLVRSNSETKQRVFYSESHFVALKADGTPASKIIKPYDNTGYRSYPGVPLHVFDDWEECKAFFEGQLEAAAVSLEKWLADTENEIRSRVEELRSSK